jgi:hypothetical protein
VITVTATITLFKVAARVRQLAGDELLSADSRAPVLFLRSFFRDHEDLSVAGAMGNPGQQLVTAIRKSFEHKLVLALQNLGPVIAIGRPGERIPPRGAARIQVGEGGDWQSEVLQRAADASLIAILIDATPGTRWEIETLTSPQWRSKVLLVLPPRLRGGRGKEWDAGWGALRDRLPELPMVGRRTVAVTLRENPFRAIERVFGVDEITGMALGCGVPEISEPARRRYIRLWVKVGAIWLVFAALAVIGLVAVLSD